MTFAPLCNLFSSINGSGSVLMVYGPRLTCNVSSIHNEIEWRDAFAKQGVVHDSGA